MARAFTLGLRHGLDADHIVAIDNITRKLFQENKSSATIGFYFAIGHSTILFCLTLIVVLGVNTSHALYSTLSTLGDKIGSMISISFLLLTIIMNVIAFRNLDNLRNNKSNLYPGLIFTFANKYLFKAIDRPEKMFIVGFFFGLDFGCVQNSNISTVCGASPVAWSLIPAPTRSRSAEKSPNTSLSSSGTVILKIPASISCGDAPAEYALVYLNKLRTPEPNSYARPI